jgi:hypothetical protein
LINDVAEFDHKLRFEFEVLSLILSD